MFNQYNPASYIYGTQFLETQYQSQKSDQINFVCFDYVKDYPKFSLTEAFEDGIHGVVDRLPELPNEEKETYNKRKEAATLNNYVTRLSRATVSAIFRKDAELENIPPFLEKLLPKLDGQKDVQEVLKDLTYLLVRDGGCFVVVDAPKFGDEGQPFVKILERSKVINWRFVPNSSELEMAVTVESYLTNNGEFGQQSVMRYRHYRMVEGVCHIAVYEQSMVRSAQQDAFELIEDIKTDFDFLPVEKLDIKTSPMYETALLNLKMMSFESLLDRYMQLSVLPQPIFWGVDTDEDGNYQHSKPAMVLGVDSAVFFTGDKSESDFEWREVSGSSITLTRDHIEQIKEDCLQAYERSQNDVVKSSNESATTSKIRNSSSTAFLSYVATLVEESATSVFTKLAKMVGESFDNSEVHINTDFNPSIDQSNAQNILTAFSTGVITQESALLSLMATETIQLSGTVEEEVEATVANDLLAEDDEDLYDEYE